MIKVQRRPLIEDTQVNEFVYGIFAAWNSSLNCQTVYFKV